MEWAKKVAQASCIDSTASPEAVFAREVAKLQEENFKPMEQMTLEPFERDHAVGGAGPAQDAQDGERDGDAGGDRKSVV